MNKGFSLIELMVALVLGLLVVLGVSQLFATLSSVSGQVERLNERQESLRYLADIISRDVRTSGSLLVSPEVNDDDNLVDILPADARCGVDLLDDQESGEALLWLDFRSSSGSLRPSDTYCSSSQDLSELAYFSENDGGAISMCYFCAGDDSPRIVTIYENVSVNFVGVSPQAVKVIVAFEGSVGYSGAAESEGSKVYEFSAVSRGGAIR